jgi:phospholipid-binding lipoprotein MlaA
MENREKKYIFIILLFLNLTISSCSYNQNDIDPYETTNRKIYEFNNTFDKYVTRPVAIAYDSIIPDIVEKRISNVFSNLGEITNIGNDVLQLEAEQALSDTWRFAVNSTFGILGIFDVAEEIDLHKNKQYFGKTLAYWGYDKSPFIMIPFFGPSTVYDSISIPVDSFAISAWPYIEPASTADKMRALNLINLRSHALAFEGAINNAFDPYIFVRNAYLQNREKFINFRPEND